MQGLTPILAIVLCCELLACQGAECDDTKCKPHSCVERELESLERPDEYKMSADDVFAATEGTWAGDGILVEVRRKSGEVLYGELRRADGSPAANVSEVARLDCAHIFVPADVTVTSIADDGGFEESDEFNQIAVWGTDLAAMGRTPEDGVELSYSGMYLAFPTMPGSQLHFGLDGTLWKIRGVDDVEQVAMRER